ncbi:LytTR family two component transcriptional regulator [Kineothrix alysoides]|uniref:Stage 0 sporulation protein A homolog n=1 Tax=Kineothrix alysoides TaxID=1469948 RepID=A0A4R1QY44_9FIRM|nr:response regulator [Kineothrix alysoides]TCL57604.1 LytTR family two component transcriptional regulator [Kineothrix alysoides]
MYHVAICDDDKRFVQYVKRMILNCELNENEVFFHEYYSGEELIEGCTAQENVDLLILDMQMRQLDGNETAKQFRKSFPTSILVFCSGVCRPTVECFESAPFRYLLKSYTDARINQEMRIIIKEMKERKEEPYIVGNWYYNTVKLKPQEILYIAIAKNGSSIYICPNIKKYDFESSITCKERVDELYCVLKDYGFAYAHNSYIVNLRYIKRKTITELELTDGTILSIARSKEKELRMELAKSMAKKY